MFLHVVLINDFGKPFEWSDLKREGMTVMQRFSLTEYAIPKAATFNLLGDNENSGSKNISAKPVSHWKSRIYLSMLVDDFTVSRQDIPPEMGNLVR